MGKIAVLRDELVNILLCRIILLGSFCYNSHVKVCLLLQMCHLVVFGNTHLSSRRGEKPPSFFSFYVTLSVCMIHSHTHATDAGESKQVVDCLCNPAWSEYLTKCLFPALKSITGGGPC